MAQTSMQHNQHSRFTIMNYGSESRLTEADHRDFARLYDVAGSSNPETKIGSGVRLVKARHTTMQ